MSTISELRSLFLDYFQQHGHLIVPSSSLIPSGDPTLLLTTAGMVQMKPYFLGIAAPPNVKLTSAQKCFRATDIESVGDSKHLTFFEMLGNFSVGDYFKPEAIKYGWDFCTNWLSLPSDRLLITIHRDDDESMALWQELAGISLDRIYRYDERDNWWGPPGTEGPCGPCSEIHYDFGEHFGCDRLAQPDEIDSWIRSGMKPSEQPGCHPNCNRCDRFVELWNLVFMEFYQDPEARFTALESPNIDTGLGLERAAVISQNVRDVYETDAFLPIIETVTRTTGQMYGYDPDTDRSIRIVAEHARAATFLTGDGIIPSNEGRGYVLRRLVRRAVRFGRKLGMTHSFLGNIVDSVCLQMGDVYPELLENQLFIRTVLTAEEDQYENVSMKGVNIVIGMAHFRQACREVLISMASFEKNDLVSKVTTLLQGSNTPVDSGGMIGFRLASRSLEEILEETIVNDEDMTVLEHWGRTLSGFEVFSLQDTYGFPLEETREVATEYGLCIDLDQFTEQMEAQKERGRLSGKFGDSSTAKIFRYQALDNTLVEFVGYDFLTATAEVVSLLTNDDRVTTVQEGDEVEVILAKTPFYPEGGGQIGDVGELVGENGRIRISDTQSPIEGLIIHRGKVLKGSVDVGCLVEARVDPDHRSDVARNHTATHLLHAALRQVVGPHIRQAGSLVSNDRLRFDFTHMEQIATDKIRDIERLVNQQILGNQPISKSEMPYQEAIAEGALAFFGDRYGTDVRVVRVGCSKAASDSVDECFSKEVCGGTHLNSAGEIGLILVTSEGSIGSGIRRIEAVTGRLALEKARNNLTLLDSLSHRLETPTLELESRIGNLLDQLESERRRVNVLEKDRALGQVDYLLSQVQDVDGISLLTGEVSATSSETLREIGDRLRTKMGSGIVVLGAVMSGRPSVLAMVTEDLTGSGISAVDIVKKIAVSLDGGGGGRADVAQAGGSDVAGLPKALAQVRSMISLRST